MTNQSRERALPSWFFVCDNAACLNEAAESCTIDGESPVVEKRVVALVALAALAASACFVSRVAWGT